MKDDQRSLGALREEIDRIDDTLLDLLVKRAGLAAQVGRSKGKGVALRPEREAMILHRLLDRDLGHLPKGAIVRIWREIFGTMLSLQGPLIIAAYQPKRGAGFLEIGRDHFGSQAQVKPIGSTGQVVREVLEGRASVGLLPLVRGEDMEPWWAPLLWEAQAGGKSAAGGSAPARVIARLPFTGPGEGRGDGQEAFALARVEPAATGRDRSLIAAETSAAVSRSAVNRLVQEAGITATSYCDIHDAGDIRLHLLEVNGFLAPDAPQVKALPKAGDGNSIGRAVVVGAYAMPLSLDETVGANR